LAPVPIEATASPAVPTTDGTIAPTVTSSKFPLCNVCGDGKEVGNPDGLALDGTISCSDLATLGASGGLEPDQCSAVVERIQDECACSEPIEGQVVMTLFSVPSQMSPKITQQFEDSLVQFYRDNSPDTSRNYTDWSARIISQNQVEEAAARRYNRNRLRLRHLQEDSNSTLFPLLTRTVMSALVQGGESQDQAAFEDSLRETIDANMTGFTDLLTTANSEYFSSVQTVETSDPAVVETPAPDVNATTSAPSAAPVPAPIDDGGLSAGAIVGIVFGVIAVIAVVFFVVKKSQEGDATAAAAAAGAGTAGAVDDEQPRAASKAVAAATMEKQASSGMDRSPKPKDKPHVPLWHTVTREIVAPPGKLGLVLDTMEGRGPIVHRVHIDSPMEGKIFKQDVIVSVAGVDTRFMNATHVTKLMHETAEQERILRIEREEPMTKTELLAAEAAALGAAVAASATSRSAAAAGPLLVLVEITAPKGKLGIVLDTVEGKGPIVHRVQSESPLKGKVFEGDIIVSINGVDTRPMDATKITTIMIETAENERQLVVERVDRAPPKSLPLAQSIST
jgi:hypothetical protein